MATNAIDLGHVRGNALFKRIGAFLAEHRLSPDPGHYAFAYRVLHGGGALAARVAALTDGGVRLSASDIEKLGGVATAGAPNDETADGEGDVAAVGSNTLVDRALTQLDGFADTVRLVHAETNDFGRDLARSAEAMRLLGPAVGIEEITRLTGAMLERVQVAEGRLAAAQRESDELRAALDEARDSARTDALTELPNRRAFDEAFAALRPEAMVTVAICDIDHFKRVNDSFGHEVGDRVLKMVAQVLAGSDAYVARYGGEEFALLFDSADVSAADDAIATLRATLSARHLKVRETGEPIGHMSFSTGIASGRVAEGRATLMRAADAALYGAKRNGRARTVIAP